MAYYSPYQNQYMSQMQQNPPVQFQQTPQYAPTQNNNGLIWVQGEAGAKSYLVAPNTTVMLMDSETQRFYLKSSDASGMPLPLRIFEYTEKAQNAPQSVSNVQPIDYSSFATKAEFEAFKGEIEGLLKNVPRQVVKQEANADG